MSLKNIECGMTMGMDRKESSDIAGVSRGNQFRGCLQNDLFPHPGKSLLALAVFLALTGCVQVPANRQRLVSKSNMGFSESLVFNYQNKLLPQVEPGSTFSGGAQSSGCTSCK
jgi:hypothetical protein